MNPGKVFAHPSCHPRFEVTRRDVPAGTTLDTVLGLALRDGHRATHTRRRGVVVVWQARAAPWSRGSRAVLHRARRREPARATDDIVAQPRRRQSSVVAAAAATVTSTTPVPSASTTKAPPPQAHDALRRRHGDGRHTGAARRSARATRRAPPTRGRRTGWAGSCARRATGCASRRSTCRRACRGACGCRPGDPSTSSPTRPASTRRGRTSSSARTSTPCRSRPGPRTTRRAS